MIVCLCFPTSDRDIDACVRDGARTVDEIGDLCGAGTGCGACRDELRERLERCGAEPGESDVSGDRPRPGGCSGRLVSVRSRQAA